MRTRHPRTLRLPILGAALAAASLVTSSPFSLAASAAPTPTYEAATVRAVKPSITATINALEKGDLTEARQAEQQYNILWHGVEVYLNFRSKPTYDVLEGDIQGRLEKELAKPDANAQTALGIAQELRTKYDEVIALIEKGAPIGPLFDDIQVVRHNRAALAQGTVAELNAGNLPRARAFWSTFATGYPRSAAVLRVRNAVLADDLDTAFQSAAAAFADPTTTIDALKPLAAAVNTKFGVELSLLNAAARNAVLTKKKATAADLAQLKTLNQVRIALAKTAALRRVNDPTAVDAIAVATGPAFAAIQPILAPKNAADVPLATALKSLAVATAGTDLPAFETALTAANNSVLVAQQVLVGQFWTDANVQRAVAALPVK